MPGHDPVARYGGCCLRVQAFQPVFQALLDGVLGGRSDACGKFLVNAGIARGTEVADDRSGGLARSLLH
jgi:hypothetical protein